MAEYALYGNWPRRGTSIVQLGGLNLPGSHPETLDWDGDPGTPETDALMAPGILPAMGYFGDADIARCPDVKFGWEAEDTSKAATLPLAARSQT